jgi:glyoxylase-like metal-dependent hydrolase (beta-lactamase superfamily II)
MNPTPAYTLHAYASLPPGSVNSYWLETPQGIILVDAQRQLSFAAQLLDLFRGTGKPLLGILLTHAHPDHIGGLARLTEAYPEVPIYATEAVGREMQDDPQGYRKLARRELGEDFPDRIPSPTQWVRDGQEIILGGLTIRVHDIGPGEAAAMTMYYLPAGKDLLAGDLVQHGMVPFLLEGRLSAWLDQLDEVEKRYPPEATLHPGHGESGPLPALIATQREYLSLVRQLVKAQRQAGEALTDEQKKEMAEIIEIRFPSPDVVAVIPGLREMNLEAVAAEMDREAQAVAGTMPG